MKYWTYIFLLIIISCNSQQQKTANIDTTASAVSNSLTDTKIESNKDVCWTGTLNEKIPVFLHYKADSNLITGEIIYLNTKDKQPITLLGTIEDDKSYRLLEFEKSGNITGIITGSTTNTAFNGSWFSPKTRKELSLHLTKKDTTVTPVITATNPSNIFGHYHYQYSEAGAQGDFEIKKLTDSSAMFGISAVTDEPSRNIAQIEEDTVKLSSTRFIYSLPGTNDCEFEVKF